MSMDAASCAFPGNTDGYTVFQYGKHTIRFQALYSLVRDTGSSKTSSRRSHAAGKTHVL